MAAGDPRADCLSIEDEDAPWASGWFTLTAKATGNQTIGTLDFTVSPTMIGPGNPPHLP